MNTQPGVDYQMVNCDICLKEIPESEVDVEEAKDYVAYFCGLECYERWINQDKS